MVWTEKDRSIREISVDNHLDVFTGHRLQQRWLEQVNIASLRRGGTDAVRPTSKRRDKQMYRQNGVAPRVTYVTISQPFLSLLA
ncbi:hypothetical protein TNCV_1445571 [Trichonephila clavipes]|nr:hypothetical protein TNCV_1445571 [Trichonephila clavipes]